MNLKTFLVSTVRLVSIQLLNIYLNYLWNSSGDFNIARCGWRKINKLIARQFWTYHSKLGLHNVTKMIFFLKMIYSIKMCIANKPDSPDLPYILHQHIQLYIPFGWYGTTIFESSFNIRVSMNAGPNQNSNLR